MKHDGINANKVVVIGNGNLAWHLVKQLRSSSKLEVEVLGRRKSKALSRFKELQCKTNTQFSKTDQNASAYFLCVNDDAIGTVSSQLDTIHPNALVIHCSGNKPIHELMNKTGRKAVFYPLQTFSQNAQMNWKEIPIFIEASDRTTLIRLKKIALIFTKKIHTLSSEKRKHLHLCAVMVNNLVNGLFIAADELMRHKVKTVGFEVLMPLIRQTIDKLEVSTPSSAQTGPAKRRDVKVMTEHQNLLGNDPSLKIVYKELSRYIIKKT